MKWSEYSNRIVWFSSKQLLLCSQGKEPSDQHIRQVCMRVMQGESGSRYFYHFRSKRNFLLCMQSCTFAIRASELSRQENNYWPDERDKFERKFVFCFKDSFWFYSDEQRHFTKVSHQFCLSPSPLEHMPAIPSWLFHSHFTEIFIFVSADLHFCLIVMSFLLQLGFLRQKTPRKSSVKHHAAYIFRTFSDWKLKFTVP